MLAAVYENSAAIDQESSGADQWGNFLPGERPVFTIWPSLGMFRLGQWIGRAAELRWGIPPVLVLGNFLAVALLPLLVVLFLLKYAPGVIRRYDVTSHRIAIRQGFRRRTVAAIGMLEWDRIELDSRPGHKALHCADLVFLAGQREVFRLPAVPTPETYRHALQELQRVFRAFRDLAGQSPKE
jgi:membrane protein YdbS with pleckstrin-like domain